MKVNKLRLHGFKSFADAIDIPIQPGVTGIVGPNGCGKSTLLRVVADLIAPTNGAVSVLGVSPEQARRNRALGFVFQDSALLPWRTALQNVELPLEAGPLSVAMFAMVSGLSLERLTQPDAVDADLSRRISDIWLQALAQGRLSAARARGG